MEALELAPCGPEVARLEAELAAARRELEERKLIERAKGVLMTALRVPEPLAFRTLQKAARDRNLRLADVARRIVEQQAEIQNVPNR
jgi:response regulator NasT